MQHDGARLSKLKEIFKRAVQEIMKEEQAVKSLILSPTFRDSFFSETTMQMSPEDVGKLFQDIKARFTEVFKAKIRQTNLDYKLNNLDKDIKDGRMSYKDIKNGEYIEEILESNIVDKKEELVKFIEKEICECDQGIVKMQNEVAELKANLKLLEYENEECEREYQMLVTEIESIIHD
ncbi:uncharacterized protein VICG_00724 [Vittaforma corneae ATCC 50505]|uniref:Uncharacterized protein n=1 Tax=Vittaforma corneae (strain ATCC 50505) TaxID=993615 RepID=L2GNX6_VITCO|nr:uncharacterized protein VICG_00724 [Vittaforma corneae ATCC 50505]ELA42324.1 hypothetical protein VICG_00724 [Vittaforma corneae ATCC 50505]